MTQVLFEITHGLYILTSRSQDKINGQCLDALMQVTHKPCCLAICVNKKNLTHDMIMESGLFIANIVDKHDPTWREKIKKFGFASGRNIDKFASNISYKLSESGIPYLPEAKAYIECHIDREKILDVGTHTLFVGYIDNAVMQTNGEPLTYNEYRKQIHPSTSSG